ncbi:MAG: sulfatase [Planctomycetota bacterium]
MSVRLEEMNVIIKIYISIIILVLLTGGCSQIQGWQHKADRPNVLFIAVDDLNDWVAVMGGHPEVNTPHIDRLARRGVLFTRAYCSAPACNPSRASLLTGLRPSTTGVYLNPHIWRKAVPEAVTLPQHFMAHGYYVVGGGKIFHSNYHDPPSWHEYFKDPRQVHPPNRPSHGIMSFRLMNDWGPVDVPDEAMSDMKIAQWAVGQLNKKHDKPLFLAVGFNRPHVPWYAPRKYFDLYPLATITMPTVKENDLDDLPKTAKGWAAPWKYHQKIIQAGRWRQAVQAYLASISFVDVCVGRLIDALDKSPYAKNTIVVLWSDHGYHLGEKSHWGKFALWEKATRNPMIMVVPGLTKPKQQCHRPVSLLDIYPTLIELCKLEPKKELEGVSLAGLLKNPDGKRGRPVITTHGRGHHAVRTDRWRYIRYSNRLEELYDHTKDPMEWTNLADKPEHADIKLQLAKHLPAHNAENAPSRPRFSQITFKQLNQQKSKEHKTLIETKD